MNICLGTVQAFAFNYAQRGWMKCEGQLLQINDYNALFSLLGTTYGGNGRDTFALPNINPTGSATVGVLNYCICVEHAEFPLRKRDD
ncbi:MAG: phage tail protein [Saprospiraceae bacterium]